MSAILDPDLDFRGRAREALESSRTVFGGELVANSFQDLGMPVEDPARSGWVVHGRLTTASGFTLMGSDVPSPMPWRAGDDAFSVSLSATTPSSSPDTGSGSRRARRSRSR